MNLRLQSLALKQNDSFAAQTALMNERKIAFIAEVVAAREEKDATEAAAKAAAAAEAADDEKRQLSMALEKKAEADEILRETASLHNTVCMVPPWQPPECTQRALRGWLPALM